MFYNEEDIEYYEKIASFGRKELITEIGKWKKKYKTNKLPWIPEDDLSDQSGDDLYFMCIQLNHEFYQLMKEQKESKEPKTTKAPKTTKVTKTTKKVENPKEGKKEKNKSGKSSKRKTAKKIN